MTKRAGSKKRETCYMCPRTATSREHVPPVCFFPEQSELLASSDLRRNLITVPSCDQHNSLKSGDDQYMLAVLLVHSENNDLAVAHFKKKVIPMMHRKPKLLRFYRNLRRVSVGGSVTGAFSLDIQRFEKAMSCMAKGIYFHHFGRKPIKDPAMLTSAIHLLGAPDTRQREAYIREYRRVSDTQVDQFRRFGENQEIFYYQVVEEPEGHRIAIRLVFYEGVVIDTLFDEGNDPGPG